MPEPPTKRHKDCSIDDPIITFNVGGITYQTARSTIIWGTPESSYLHNIISSKWQDSSKESIFIDRDGQSFRHILNYIRNQKLFIPEYESAKDQWHELKNEAEFYGLDDLVKVLTPNSMIFKPESGGKGILFWLGTRKGTASYENPHMLGLVRAGGFVDTPLEKLLAMGKSRDLILALKAERQKESFVQHRPANDYTDVGLHNIPPFKVLMSPKDVDHHCCMLPEWAPTDSTVVIDFKATAVRPTHYSFRTGRTYSRPFNCGNWTFEGSENGKDWEILHEVKNYKWAYETTESISDELEDSLQTENLFYATDKESQYQYYCDTFAEEHLRGTWEIADIPNKYYRYFQVKKTESNDTSQGLCFCFGFELYGEVQQEVIEAKH